MDPELADMMRSNRFLEAVEFEEPVKHIGFMQKNGQAAEQIRQLELQRKIAEEKF